MITLAHAFRLLQIEPGDLVYLRKPGQRWTQSRVFTERDIRNKTDMKAIKVFHIGLHFSYGEPPQWYELEVNNVPTFF